MSCDQECVFLAGAIKLDKAIECGCPACKADFGFGPALVPEKVEHPAHYNAHPMECIAVLRVLLTPEEFRGFCLGNEMKYRWRAGSKPGESTTEDMAKATWYERERAERTNTDTEDSKQ